MTKANVYEMVTERIIAELEKGNIPWQKPWTGVRSGAYNRITKKPYSIINQILLRHTGEYATFKQWSDLGGHIKKGEKSEIVVFWKIYQKEETNEETGEKEACCHGNQDNGSNDPVITCRRNNDCDKHSI